MTLLENDLQSSVWRLSRPIIQPKRIQSWQEKMSTVSFSCVFSFNYLPTLISSELQLYHSLRRSSSAVVHHINVCGTVKWEQGSIKVKGVSLFPNFSALPLATAERSAESEWEMIKNRRNKGWGEEKKKRNQRCKQRLLNNLLLTKSQEGKCFLVQSIERALPKQLLRNGGSRRF